MKKIISILLVALIPLMMFAGCKSNPEETTTEAKFSLGIYIMDSDANTPCQLEIRPENKIVIRYNSNMRMEVGTYTMDNDIIHSTIEKNGSEYIFKFEDGNLYYDAANSKPSDNFTKLSGVSDGSVFNLSQSFEVK